MKAYIIILEVVFLLGAFTSVILLDNFARGTFYIILCVYVRLLRYEKETSE